MIELAWYILTVSPLCEKAVASRLKRRFGDDIETYLPVSRRTERRRHRRVPIETVVFPRYLLVGFAAPPQWLYVREVLGVQGVFAVDGAPLRVDATLVGDLMSRCASGDFDPAPEPKIQRGMTVRARSGPFRGNEGQVSIVSKTDDHAHVLLELFHGTVPARIHLDDLVSVSYASMRTIG